jgi:hypothetical protein
MALQCTNSVFAATVGADESIAADGVGNAGGACNAGAIGVAREASGPIGEPDAEFDAGCDALFDRRQAGKRSNEKNSTAAPKRMSIV